MSYKKCEHCSKAQQRYYILQTELKFEIKKLNEDMAEQKLTLQMNHQKEVKKYAEKLKHQKDGRQIQNKKWMQKYDSTLACFQNKIKEKEDECEQKIRQIQIELSKKKEREICESQYKIKGEIEQLRGESQEYKKKLSNVKQEEKKLQQKYHQQEIAKLIEKHQKEKQIMQGEKTQCMNVISQHQRKQLEQQTAMIQLGQEIYYLKQENQDLKNKLSQIREVNKLREEELTLKDRRIDVVRKECAQKIKKIEQQFQIERNQIIKNNSEKIEKLLLDEMKSCEEYETKLKKMEQKRQTELSLYHQSVEQMKVLTEEKKCPPKFKEQINSLKVRLNSREKDFQKALRDIKEYQLQIENKEDTFNKFLNPNNISTMSDAFSHAGKKKDYSIKKNRISLSRVSIKDFSRDSAAKYSSTNDDMNHMTSLQTLDLFKQYTLKLL